MTSTIMIATRDRRCSLEITCAKLADLQPAPNEVLICADGCRDDTAEMVRSRFPQFQLLNNPRPRGSVFSRDRMLRMAIGEVVVSFDDDSYPLRPDFLRTLAQVIEDHPEAAVVAFPEVQTEAAYAFSDRTGAAVGRYVAAYANCGAAMRRAFYLKRPGFPHFFSHMYEEPDYALQCYSAGAAVWFEPGLAIHHEPSPINRRPMQRHHFNARNELWSVWLRCPWPWLPVVSAYRVIRQAAYAGSEGVDWLIREPVWWLATLKGLSQCRVRRQAVPWRVYYGWLRLARNPIYRAEDLRARFRCGSSLEGPANPFAEGCKS